MTAKASSATTAPHLKTPRYRPDIDGLRAVAVLSVIGFHAAPDWIKGGFVGVDIFFVISGFLISTIIYTNLEHGTFSFAEFYARRIKRIFPALILVLGAAYIAGHFSLFPHEYRQLSTHIAGSAGFISNFILWNEAGYFDNLRETKPLAHIWSLGIEEQFYIIWPLLLFIAQKARIPFLPLTLAILTASFVANIYIAQTDMTAAFYAPWTRFWELLAGGVLAYFTLHRIRLLHWFGYISHSQPGAPSRSFKILGEIKSTAGVFFISISMFLYSQDIRFPSWGALAPVIGACLLISAGSDAWANRLILSRKIMVWIGLISYPLYLWHWALLSFCHIIHGRAPTPFFCGVGIILSFVLSWLTYILIERPIRFGRGYNTLKISVLCLLLLIIGTAGYYSYIHTRIRLSVAPDQTRFKIEGSLPYAMTLTMDKLYQNVTCKKSLNKEEVKNEICFSSSAQPRMLITGDSHALAFYAAIYADKSPLNAMLIAAHGCLPFTNYISLSKDEQEAANKNCMAVAQDAITTVADIPSIETVILVSRGPYYFLNSDFKVRKNDAGEEVAENIEMDLDLYAADGVTIIEPQKAFVEGYSDIIGKFRELRKQVVFVIDVPELGVDPNTCFSQSETVDTLRSIMSCTVKRSVADERQREYRRLVAEIKKRNPGLLIYDPISLFCSNEVCHGRNENIVYYSDKDHLSIDGSEMVLNDFRKWLNQH